MAPATRNVVQQLSHRRYAIPWDAAPVAVANGLFKATILRFIPELLASAAERSWGVDYCKGAFAPICGDIRSPLHGFACTPIGWGFQLTEPQVTRALAYFLSPEIHGEAGLRRCEAFVKALYRAAGRIGAEPQQLDLVNAQKETVTVAPEIPTSKARRIDLVIQWKTAEGVRQMVVLECKFTHHVTDDQLPPYEEFARSSTKRRADYELFLVANNLMGRTAVEISKNSSWKALTWPSLLRRLELELAGGERCTTSSADFARLRRTISDMSSSYGF